MRRLRNVGLLLAACALLLPLTALAQTTGTLSGTVVDTKDAPVAFATVTVTGAAGERQALTDEDGRFLFAFLTPGKYRVFISAEGFSPMTDEDVTVSLNQRTDKHYTLLGVEQEEVRVTAREERFLKSQRWRRNGRSG